MRRIERPAQQADDHAAPCPGQIGAQKGAVRAQGAEIRIRQAKWRKIKGVQTVRIIRAPSWGSKQVHMDTAP
ncbi:hypothetical protein GCM10011345_00620 [Gemmobacter megaterium]|nr:hypothetical protein GCM10011345_00620 [Gemmobacter megaterium]